MTTVVPERRPGEVAAALLVTVYAALLGPIVGLVWAAVAPKLSVPQLAANSDPVFHALIGADAWFLLVGGVAGLLTTVAVLVLLGEPGPGVTVGLALGGSLGAIIADRVGYLSERGATTHALRAIGARLDGGLISEIDFRIRALGVLAVWPLVSLVIVGFVVGFVQSRR
jgi:hypothetical protein